MEINLSINGDPGTGNSFNDTKIRKVDNYNPNAREVNNYYTQSESRLGGWFRRLNDEINNDIRLQKKLDDIKRYRTKLPHTIGLEAKLKDGGFSQSAIDKARRLKMYFASIMSQPSSSTDICLPSYATVSTHTYCLTSKAIRFAISDRWYTKKWCCR